MHFKFFFANVLSFCYVDLAKEAEMKFNQAIVYASIHLFGWDSEGHRFLVLMWQDHPQNPWKSFWNDIPDGQKDLYFLVINGNTRCIILKKGYDVFEV